MPRKHTLETFIKKSEKLYPEKFDYSLVIYQNNYTKVKIKCKTCGKIFEIKPYEFWRIGGCCTRKVPYKKIPRKTTESFIKEAENIYGKGTYGYDKVEYINSYTKIKIWCPTCQEYFEIIPASFLNKRRAGCPKCGNRRAGEKLRTPQETWIKRATEKWGDVCDYSETIYRGDRHQVRIFCKEHQGYFEQRPSTHMRGAYGCPECAFKHEALQSLGEREIEKVLTELGIDYKKEYIINNLIDGRNSKKVRIDFRYTIDDVEYWIEFHGEQHYTDIKFFSHGDPEWFEKQQKRDENVREYSNTNDIRLLEIPYTYLDHFKIYRLITEFNSGTSPEIIVPKQKESR